MAVGEVTRTAWSRSVKLLEAATAANSPPTLATHGIDLSDVFNAARPSTAAIMVRSTAGSGTMTVTLRQWGYAPAVAVWMPLGAHATAASRGVLNLGNAIDEIAADTIRHCESIAVPPLHFTRFYLEITAIGGTATAISAWLVAAVDS